MMCGPALWGLGRLRDVYPIYRSYIVTVMRDAAYDWPHRRPHRTAYTYTGTGCTGGLSINGNKKPQTTQRNGKHARAHANPRRYDQHDIQIFTARVCPSTLTEL